MEKVYKVRFMKYNYLGDSVYNNDDKLLYVGDDTLIIKESDLAKYIKYGNGFRTVEFVGNMLL